MSTRSERCAPVPLEVLYRLPPGFAFRLFVLAAADGRAMNPRETFDALAPRERPIGVRVSEVHRDRILGTIGVELRQWQRAVRAWKGAGLAHGCRNGRVYLSLRWPPPAVCPDCKRPFEDARTRHFVNLNASSSEPSYVQNGEPSTGTQGGDGGFPTDYITPEVARRIQEEGSSENASISDEEALSNIAATFTEETA